MSSAAFKAFPMLSSCRRVGYWLLGGAVAYRASRYATTRLMRLWASVRLRRLQGQCYVDETPQFLQSVIVVSSKRLFETLRRGLKDRVVPETLVMGGGHPRNILSSYGKCWQTQQKVIHKWILNAGQHYSACLDTQLQLLQWEDGGIDLLSECARVNRRAITEALGIPMFEYSARRMLMLVIGYSAIVQRFGPPEWLAERIASCLHEVLFGRETRRIAKLLGVGPCAASLVEAFGLSETMGHLWAIVNGASIPEASIVCDIIADLAKNPTEQDHVFEVLEQSRTEEFTQWIREQCREHVFFPYQVKVLAHDVVVDGVHLAGGQLIKVPLKWLNDVYPDMYTTGFGLRKCPGARIGFHSIETWVAYLVRNYTFQARSGWLSSYVCRQAARPYSDLTMGQTHMVAGCFHVTRRRDRKL